MVDRSFSDYYDTPENQIYLISAAGIAAVFAALGRLIKFPKIENFKIYIVWCILELSKENLAVLFLIYQKFKSHRNSIIFGVCSILVANIIAGVVDVIHFLYRLDHNGSEYSGLIRLT